MYEIDLFQLIDEKDKGRQKIKAVINDKIKSLIEQMIGEIKEFNHTTTQQICKDIGITFVLYRMHMRRGLFCLDALEKLADKWAKITLKTENAHLNKKKEIQREITKLSYGSGNNHRVVACPKYLTLNLCKISGAIIADGHLAKTSKKYTIIIADQHDDILNHFSEWITEEFNVKLTVKQKKDERCYYIEFSNKIIFYYMNKIFDIPSGEKSRIVKTPEIIRNATVNFQRAFATGVLIFDGGVGFCTSKFDFSTTSKNLFADIINTLKNAGIKVTYSNDGFNRTNSLYQFYVSGKDNANRFLKLFLLPNTKKYSQLDILLNNFDCKINNLNHVKKYLNHMFPRSRVNTITFLDVIDLFKYEKQLSTREIENKLKRSYRTINRYLCILKRWNIIIESNEKTYKAWILNPKLK
ncbi:MAG: HTH domain-containing protein [Nanoarchaeota archaeon]|nr:HTH domain-containing protein [Nanoarchaeota archaeon]MBU4124133.1 HTH domain-containing protein [Nanoarchaeota archaeon]